MVAPRDPCVRFYWESRGVFSLIRAKIRSMSVIIVILGIVIVFSIFEVLFSPHAKSRNSGNKDQCEATPGAQGGGAPLDPNDAIPPRGGKKKKKKKKKSS